jgi:Ca-activated chloride channel family protein
MVNNLHFMHPEWLWLLLAIPAIWAVRLLKRQHKGSWERIIDKHLMPFVLSGKEGSLGIIPLILLSCGLLLGVLAMAGPAWEKREVPVYRNQQALVVAMDFSASMYAADEKPDRLTLARFKLLDILKARQDGQTGLVVFAGDAFMVSPLTDDIDTIQEQVKNLSPDIMPAQGSLLKPAIERSGELLKQAGMRQGNILLITDGASDPEEAAQAAEQAKQMGYRVSVLSVGSQAGAKIPRGNGGFLLDNSGNAVVAKVNKPELQAIAQAGGGVFASAALGDADLAALSSQWKAEAETGVASGQGRQVDTWVNEGYWLVLLLLPFAAVAFRRGWLGAVLVCFLLPQPQTVQAMTWDDLWQTPDQQGQQALASGQAKEAAKLFQNPDWKAAAAYKSQDYKAAAEQYASAKTPDGQYNYGNTLAKQGKLQEAVSAYEKVLAADPNHADARHNLDVVKKALEKQRKDQKDQQKDQKDQKDQKGNQGKDQQQQQSQENSQGQQDKQQQAKQEQDKQAQEKQAQAEQEAKKQEEAAQKQQQAQQDKQDKQGKEQEKAQKESKEDPQQREQKQATEQWLRRIPDDPAGLWRRKFQYQYQQRGSQARGEEW